MAGIAGVISIGPRPCTPDEVAAMTAAMSYRGGDGLHHWISDRAQLGQCLLHTNGEALGSPLPLVSEDGCRVLVLDGWLSNWTELSATLKQLGCRLRSAADAELILKAFETWGPNCVEKIDGDFAFAIYDHRNHSLFCARDRIGCRQLHFARDGDTFIFSTDVNAILATGRVGARPNLGVVAEVLSGDWYTRDGTIWQGIERLLPAHTLLVDGAANAQLRYWSPPVDSQPLYRCEQEYFEHYRWLFLDCVRRTCRSDRTVACEISGGLDSSASACAAAKLRAEGRLPAPGLLGYTWRFDEGGEVDELAYARAAARHAAIALAEVPPFRPSLADYEARLAADRSLTDYPNGIMAHSLRAKMASDGCRVLMNGEGGDEWIAGRRTYYADAISSRRWSLLVDLLRIDIAEAGPKTALVGLLRHGVAHQLPSALRKLGSKLLRPRGPNNYNDAFWLSEPLRVRYRAQQSAHAGHHNSIRNVSQRGLAMRLENAWADHVREIIDRGAAKHGLEARSPYYDRKFVEFAFRTPEHLRLRGGINKYCHRRALDGILPVEVARRETKANFSLPFYWLLDGMETLLTETLPDRHPELFDKVGMNRLYRLYRSRDPMQDAIWELWTAFALACVLSR